MLPGDQRRVTLPQRLKQPMTYMWLCIGQAVPPMSVTCSKWYIRKAPLCSQGSAFGLESTESMPACFINLLPKSFGASLSLSEPSCNISGGYSWIQRVVCSPHCWLSVLAHQEGHPWQVPWEHVDPRGGSPSPINPRRRVPAAQRNLERLRTNLGALLIRLVRTWVQIQACLRRQKGSLINSQRHLSNPLFGVKPSSRFREGELGVRVEVLCCVGVCESASLRCSLVTKWVQSPSPQVSDEFI
jgi:hypothetical protein